MGFETITGGKGGRKQAAPSLRIVINKSTARGYLSMAALPGASRLRIEIDREGKRIRLMPVTDKSKDTLAVYRARKGLGAGSVSLGMQKLSGVPMGVRIMLTECDDGWWYGSYN